MKVTSRWQLLELQVQLSDHVLAFICRRQKIAIGIRMKDTGITWVVITFTKPEHSTPTLSNMFLQKQRESSQSYLLSLWDFSADPSALRETVGSWVLKRKSMKPPRRHGYRRSRLEGGCGIYHDDNLNKQAFLAGIGTSLNIEAGQYKLDWLLSWQDNFFPQKNALLQQYMASVDGVLLA